MKIHAIKVAIRNARKNGLLSFAKLFGISISFAVILFSTAYVYYETSFDKMVPDHDRIYRCIMYGEINGSEEDFAVTSPEMGPAMVKDLPEIISSVRIKPGGESTIYYKDKIIEGQQMLFADPEFFSFFGMNVEKVLKKTLETSHHLAISKSLAEHHFGSVEGALNQEVNLRGDNCTITAVFDDFPDNFHLHYDVIQSIEKTNPDKIGWDAQEYITYLKANTSGIDLDDLDFKLTKTVYTYSDTENRIDGANAKNWDDLKYAENMYIFYRAEPLTDIHFSKHKFDPAKTASKTYVFGAIILSMLVLVISSLNYVNLTLANLSTRFKEIGIRKTIGAYNGQIAVQFVKESLIFWVVGFAMAVLLYFFAGNPLAQYLNFDISIAEYEFVKIVIFSFIVLLIFNLVTIVLPIIYISKKSVLNLIKEKNPVGKQFSVKNSFVFLQFALSALIILGSVIVQKQISYMVSKDRGYDSDNVIMLTLWDLSHEKRKSFIEELKSYTAIKNIATSGNYFGEDPGMSSAHFDNEEDENYFHTSILAVDDEFMNTFDFELVEGRFFDKTMQSDFDAVILNQTAAEEFDGEGLLIDHQVLINGKTYNILGIVKDFNFRSLYHKIQPLVMTHVDNLGNIFVKVSNNQIKETIEILQKQWEKYDISRPLNYTFHDEVVAAHYAKDQQAKKLLLILSLISISIACVGLYAISFFTIVRKTKEIGIRKVNGASFKDILVMLNFTFTKWVLLAFLISIPVAWYAMDQWLQNFAYKTEVNWWLFALAGLAMIVIALITVSWQSWLAARRNPVESLRYE